MWHAVWDEEIVRAIGRISVIETFAKCKESLLTLVDSHMRPMAGGCFDEIDALIDEFERKVKKLERSEKEASE